MKPHVRLIDPHNDKENALANDFNVRKELSKYGVYCQRANSDPFLGKSRVREALRQVYSPLRNRKVSQFHIVRHCSHTIYEFQHYIYDEFRRNKEEQGVKEQVKKKDDDFMDCLRYIYNYGPRYIAEERDEETVHYVGEYAKYPVRNAQPSVSGVSYRDLTESR